MAASQEHGGIPRFEPVPAAAPDGNAPIRPGPAVGDGPGSTEPDSLLTPQRLIEIDSSRPLPVDGSWWPMWWEHNKYAVVSASLVTQGEHAAWDPAHSRATGRGLSQELVCAKVRPALLTLLERVSDPIAARTTIFALARIERAVSSTRPAEGAAADAGEVRAALTEKWKSADESVAEAAILAMSRLGFQADLMSLVDVLLDGERGRAMCDRADGIPHRMRAMAAYAIAQSARDVHAELARYCVHNLARVLQSEESLSDDIEVACVTAIGMIPLTPLQVSSAESSSREPSPSESLSAQIDTLIQWCPRGRSIRGIRSQHVPTALARLVRGLDSRREQRAIRTRVIDALIEVLRSSGSSSAPSRRSAASALGMIGSAGNDAVEKRLRWALINRLSEKDLGVRAFAMISLAQVGARPSWGPESAFAASHEIEVLLALHVRRGRQELRPWAALSLGVLGRGLLAKGQALTKDTGDLLLERVRETRSAEEGSAYALASALIGDGRAYDAIERSFLDFRDPASRGDVALGLGILGNRRALSCLRSIAADALHQPRVLEQCSLARAMLGDEDLLPDLLEQLPTTECWVSTAAVCRSMAWTGDQRALDLLLELLADETRSERERAAAAEALGWLADPDPNPFDQPYSVGANYVAAPISMSAEDGSGLLNRF
ncbi:MAG: HEAT repeat protein [Planctomycetota bacterium]|jgi:HEAT repeat protein